MLPPETLTISISSRALFDLTESHEVYERDGIDAYSRYQIAHENEPLKPGAAFPLVKKLLALNADHPVPIVEVILLSRNSADTGLRIFNSIQHYHLDMTRAVFTSGRSTYDYVAALNTHLFLSSDPVEVRKALDSGLAAAVILPTTPQAMPHPELRIAFDGDAVLFSDESQIIYDKEGLDSFNDNEKREAHHPLDGGPFKSFLAQLSAIQKLYPADAAPIRTALVTARSAPAHERVIRTLREWNIRIDEALFLGGKDKAVFLKAFGADLYFDDQIKYCDSAKEYVATGHVPPR
jgi:5'-nucleotidase